MRVNKIQPVAMSEVGGRRRHSRRGAGFKAIDHHIRSYTDPTFTSKRLDLWDHVNGVDLDFGRHGKPTDSTFIEAFNGRSRQECLNENWYYPCRMPRRKWSPGEDTTTAKGPIAPGQELMTVAR